MAVTFDFAAPSYGAASVSGDLDATRENSLMMFCLVALGMCPPKNGWTLTVTNSGVAPTVLEWSDGTQKVEIVHTYASGVCTKTRIRFDRGGGGGYENVVAFNRTVDGSGFLTGGTTTTG